MKLKTCSRGHKYLGSGPCPILLAQAPENGSATTRRAARATFAAKAS